MLGVSKAAPAICFHLDAFRNSTSCGLPLLIRFPSRAAHLSAVTPPAVCCARVWVSARAAWLKASPGEVDGLADPPLRGRRRGQLTPRLRHGISHIFRRRELEGLMKYAEAICGVAAKRQGTAEMATHRGGGSADATSCTDGKDWKALASCKALGGRLVPCQNWKHPMSPVGETRVGPIGISAPVILWILGTAGFSMRCNIRDDNDLYLLSGTSASNVTSRPERARYMHFEGSTHQSGSLPVESAASAVHLSSKQDTQYRRLRGNLTKALPAGQKQQAGP